MRRSPKPSPTVSRNSSPATFDLGEEEPTKVDEGEITPETLPRCTECGSVVFHDNFTDLALVIGSGMLRKGQCVRAYDGHWWFCANFSKERGKLVFLPPR